MSSGSSSIKTSHMNPIEIYGLNSYFSILPHGSNTVLQSPAFHWTSLPEATMGNTREGQPPPTPLSPWLAILTTRLGPTSQRGRVAPFLTLGSHGLSSWSLSRQHCAVKIWTVLEPESWVLILALPSKNYVAWARQMTSVPWLHRATISERLPRHIVTLVATLCNLLHHVSWDQNPRYKYIPNPKRRKTHSEQGIVLGRELELLIHSFRNIYWMLHM